MGLGEERRDPLGPGQAVDVWSPSTGDWAHGFVLAATTEDGVRVRRLSDGSVLPVLFDPGDVRPAEPSHHQRMVQRRWG